MQSMVRGPAVGPHREACQHDRHGREACDPAALLAPPLAFGTAEDVLDGEIAKLEPADAGAPEAAQAAQ